MKNTQDASFQELFNNYVYKEIVTTPIESVHYPLISDLFMTSGFSYNEKVVRFKSIALKYGLDYKGGSIPAAVGGRL